MAIKRNVIGADFDSELAARPDPRDGSTILTVVIRVLFMRMEPVNGYNSVTDHSKKTFTIKQWSDGEYKQYLKDLKTVVETDWNDKIFINLPKPRNPALGLSAKDLSHFEPRARNKTPHIKCRLRIDSVAKRYHAKIHLFNVVPGQGQFGNFVNRKQGGTDIAVLSNNAIDSKESTYRSIGPLGGEFTDVYQQTPASHEFGHILGFGHVNANSAKCKADRNLEICYGGSTWERNDIMGAGYAVTGAHAGPWLKAIERHTGHAKGWKATHLSPDIERLLAA